MPAHLRNRRRRRGTTTVEFALTAPILFLLVWGAVEFSRANVIRHTTIVAATEAARQSIIPGATAEECLAAAQRELAVVGIDSAVIEIDPEEITIDTDQVTVYIFVPLNGDNGFILPGFIRGRAIDKAVTLQREAASSNPSEEKNQRPSGTATGSDAASNSGSNSGSGSAYIGTGSSNRGSGSGNSGS